MFCFIAGMWHLEKALSPLIHLGRNFTESRGRNLVRVGQCLNYCPEEEDGKKTRLTAYLRTNIVVQGIKLLLATPASHFMSQLLSVGGQGPQWKIAPSVWAAIPMWKTWMKFFGSSWPSPGHCKIVEDEPTDERFSLSLSQVSVSESIPFFATLTFKQ